MRRAVQLVTTNHQVTVPHQIREHLGIEAGDTIEYEIVNIDKDE